MSEKGNPVVAIKSGKIAGSFENGLYIFKGIPYAATPATKVKKFISPHQEPPHF